MTLVDQFMDRNYYDFVSPEDFPVLRYSLAEATIDDAICHVTGANRVTQRKENLRIKYRRLSSIAIAQNLDSLQAEAMTRQENYVEYMANQGLLVDDPFDSLQINFEQQSIVRHLIQEEHVIVNAVREVLLPRPH